jgi:hypothetical protein
MWPRSRSSGCQLVGIRHRRDRPVAQCGPCELRGREQRTLDVRVGVDEPGDQGARRRLPLRQHPHDAASADLERAREHTARDNVQNLSGHAGGGGRFHDAVFSVIPAAAAAAACAPARARTRGNIHAPRPRRRSGREWRTGTFGRAA